MPKDHHVEKKRRVEEKSHGQLTKLATLTLPILTDVVISYLNLCSLGELALVSKFFKEVEVKSGYWLLG